jgi:predicted ArsR family transcriptional regulator
MAAALDRGGSAEALAEAAAEVGRTANLEALGYEPHERDGVVELLNCPFHALAQEHTALVCGMNLHLVDALLEGSDRRAVLDPAPGRCCVTVVGDDSGRPPGSTPA